MKTESTTRVANCMILENRDMTALIYYDANGCLAALGYKTASKVEYYALAAMRSNRKFPELKAAIECSIQDLDFKLVPLLRTVTFR